MTAGDESLRDPRSDAGRLAGWMFISGSLLAIPSSLLMEPAPDPELYLLTVLGVGTGVVCLRLPWERWPYRALHVLPVVSVIEVAIVIATFDRLFGFFYPLIIVFAALISTSRRELPPHFVAITIAVFLPVLYEPSENARECLYWALFLTPVIATTAVMVTLLREQLERNARGVEMLAGEASATAARIRSSLDGHFAARIPLRASAKSPGAAGSPRTGG